MSYPQHDAEHDAGLAWNPDDLDALESLRTYRAPRDLDNLGLPPRARQEPRDTRLEYLDLDNRYRLLRSHVHAIALDAPTRLAIRLRAALNETQ